MDPAGDGMAIRVVDSPEVDLETFRMPLEQYHGLFDEVGGVKFPIVLQVKDVLAVHSRVGVVDRSDLTDSFARADEIVRAWKRVSEKNVQHGRPILHDDELRHRVGVKPEETVERPDEEIRPSATRQHDADGRAREAALQFLPAPDPQPS